MTFISPGEFQIISHRGGSLDYPENTLFAFSETVKIHKLFAFELDVHCTKDGKIVVIHDSTLDRTTNGKGFVKHHTWDEISKLDGGYWFSKDYGTTFPMRGKGVGVPLLEDLLRQFPNQKMSIEVKEPGYEEIVVDVLKKHGAIDRVVLASFNYDVLKRLRVLSPASFSSFSKKEMKWTYVANLVGLPFLAPKKGNIMHVPLWAEGIEIVTQKLIDTAHSRGLFVQVWTIDDEDMMRQLISMGVDGIISDAPSLLAKVAQELKKI